MSPTSRNTELSEYAHKHLASEKISDKALSHVWRTGVKKPKTGRAIAKNPNLKDPQVRAELVKSNDTKTREAFAARGDLTGEETDIILADKKAAVVGVWCEYHEPTEEQLAGLLKIYRKEVAKGLLGGPVAEPEPVDEEEFEDYYHDWNDDGYGTRQITKMPPMTGPLLAHAVTLLALDRKFAGEYQAVVEKYVAAADTKAADAGLAVMKTMSEYKTGGALSKTDGSKKEAIRIIAAAWKETVGEKQRAGLTLGIGLSAALGRAAKNSVAEALLKDMKNSLGTGKGPAWEQGGLADALETLTSSLDAPLRAEFAGDRKSVV